MYDLAFHKLALKEWQKLEKTIREQLKRKLASRLENPRVEKDALSGMQDHYRIKLRSAGIRLVYRVDDEKIMVLVLSVGKRDKLSAYKKAQKR